MVSEVGVCSCTMELALPLLALDAPLHLKNRMPRTLAGIIQSLNTNSVGASNGVRDVISADNRRVSLTTADCGP